MSMLLTLRRLTPPALGLVLLLPQGAWAAPPGDAEQASPAAEVSHDGPSQAPSADETKAPETKPSAAIQAKEGAGAGNMNQRAPRTNQCLAIKPEPQKIPRYIGDWEQLSRLAGSDQDIMPMADQFASRAKFATGMAKVGVLSGLGLGLIGVISGTSGDSWSKQDKGLAIGGAGVAVLSLVTYLISMPDRSDFLDVINLWNQRHPDLPIAP
jgi:hypothetical protein